MKWGLPEGIGRAAVPLVVASVLPAGAVTAQGTAPGRGTALPPLTPQAIERAQAILAQFYGKPTAAINLRKVDFGLTLNF